MRSWKQLRDVHNIVSAQSSKLEWDYLLHWAKALRILDDVQSLRSLGE